MFGFQEISSCGTGFVQGNVICVVYVKAQEFFVFLNLGKDFIFIEM